jgi:hypothetical protein
VSIASARAMIDPKATMAVTISNIGFMISVLGDFTVDRQGDTFGGLALAITPVVPTQNTRRRCDTQLSNFADLLRADSQHESPSQFCS